MSKPTYVGPYINSNLSVMTSACHPNLRCLDNSVSKCKHCLSIRFMAVLLQWLLKMVVSTWERKITV